MRRLRRPFRKVRAISAISGCKQDETAGATPQSTDWVRADESKRKGNSMTTKTIDMTPTWEGMLPILLTLLENGSAAGRATAMAEMRKMAKLADLYVKSQPGG